MQCNVPWYGNTTNTAVLTNGILPTDNHFNEDFLAKKTLYLPGK